MTNFEIKVGISDINGIIDAVKKSGAIYKCEMHHVDYYFSTGTFKEKIREINDSEVQKISYSRLEKVGRKESKYNIENITQEEKKFLLKQNNPLCVVDKIRKLWIYKNTRIHLDSVVGLGYFLELETVIKDISVQNGLKEFKEVLELLKINQEQTVAYSYSDLILKNQKSYPSPVLINKFAGI